MLLHPRIANHSAQASLQAASALGAFGASGFEDLIFKRILRGHIGAIPATEKGARRLAAESVAIVQKTALHVEHGEDRKYGPFVKWIGMDAGKRGIPADPQTADQSEYIRLGAFAFYTRRDAFAAMRVPARTLALFSMHAVARHHQRDGHMDAHAVFAAIKQALPYVWAMRRMVNDNALKQVFAATSNGWFVGEPERFIDTGVALRFRTYLSNATEPARWMRASQQVDRCLAAIGRDACESRLLHELPGTPLAANEPELIDTLTGPGFAWLKDSYEERHDADAQAWLLHRGY